MKTKRKQKQTPTHGCLLKARAKTNNNHNNNQQLLGNGAENKTNKRKPKPTNGAYK